MACRRGSSARQVQRFNGFPADKGIRGDFPHPFGHQRGLDFIGVFPFRQASPADDGPAHGGGHDVIVAVHPHDFLRQIGAPLHVVPERGDGAGQPAVFQRGGDAQAVENIHHRGIGHLHAEQGVDAVRRDMDGAGLGQTLMPVDGALHNVASV